MDPDVDANIERSERWADEMAALRPILLDCGLTERIRWRSPCYSHDGKNIVIMQEMKAFLALMFFKGALVDDPDGVLVDQGPNSRAARRIEFTSVDDVERLGPTVAAYVRRAVEVEEAGLEVGPAPAPVLAGELQARLDADDALLAAFEALTPGRRREYNLHVSGAKKSSTRSSRVEACVPKILAGRGLRDR
ncbi:MAG: YdeI/OmpD-associated family protein [Actinomycetota bacterium]